MGSKGERVRDDTENPSDSSFLHAHKSLALLSHGISVCVNVGLCVLPVLLWSRLQKHLGLDSNGTVGA